MSYYYDGQGELLEEKKEFFRNNEIVSKNYLDWLVKTTSIMPYIGTYYLYSNVSKQDEENINDLEVIYELIAEYAKENYVEPISIEVGDFFCGDYYQVKYNGIGFEIGIDLFQGLDYYCNRVKQVDKKAIDLEKAIKGGKHPNTKKMELKLKSLEEYLMELIDSDVSGVAIRETTDKVLQKARNNKK